MVVYSGQDRYRVRRYKLVVQMLDHSTVWEPWQLGDAQTLESGQPLISPAVLLSGHPSRFYCCGLSLMLMRSVILRETFLKRRWVVRELVL